MEEKAKGRMKEAAGAVTGDEDKKAEGQEKANREGSQRSREGARQAAGQGQGRAVGQPLDTLSGRQSHQLDSTVGRSPKLRRDSGLLHAFAFAELLRTP
jgi:hypothetical protein